MKRLVKSMLVVPAVLVGTVASSQAALDLTGVTVDTAPVFTMATIVITAIASIWAIKKVIKLGNRS